MENERRDQGGSDLPAVLSKPAQRAFAQAGYTRLEQFTEVSAKEILQLHGVGPKSIRQLRDALKARISGSLQP